MFLDAGTTVTTTASAAAAVTVTTIRSTAVAAAVTAPKTGLASTGLAHTRQLVELALVFIGLGTALVFARKPGVIR